MHTLNCLTWLTSTTNHVISANFAICSPWQIFLSLCINNITGDGDKVSSGEILESKMVIKSFILQLSPNSKGDQDHTDKQHSPKVCSYRHDGGNLN